MDKSRLAQILLIEDSAGDTLLTGQIVAESPFPVRVVVARDGEQALAMLADPDFTPALIILDLNIPLISGHVFLVRNQRKEIPVVVFSVSSDPADKKRAFALGARDYFEKPMNLDQYKNVVWTILAKWAPPETSEAEGASAT
jgi:DNA-binding response OmpR family regulator